MEFERWRYSLDPSRPSGSTRHWLAETQWQDVRVSERDRNVFRIVPRPSRAHAKPREPGGSPAGAFRRMRSRKQVIHWPAPEAREVPARSSMVASMLYSAASARVADSPAPSRHSRMAVEMLGTAWVINHDSSSIALAVMSCAPRWRTGAIGSRKISLALLLLLSARDCRPTSESFSAAPRAPWRRHAADRSGGCERRRLAARR